MLIFGALQPFAAMNVWPPGWQIAMHKAAYGANEEDGFWTPRSDNGRLGRRQKCAGAGQIMKPERRCRNP